MNSSLNDVVLAEFWEGGHRCYYLEAAARGGFAGRYLVSPEVYERLPVEVRTLAAGRFEIAPGTRNSHWAQVMAIRRLQSSSRRAGRVVCLFLDDLLLPLSVWASLPGARRWMAGLGGILFGNRHFHLAGTDRRSRRRLSVQTFLLRRLATQSRTGRLLMHDDQWLEYLAQNGVRRTQLAVVPDPIIPERARLPVPKPRPADRRFTIGFYGEHAPRKGTAWALRVLAESGQPWRAVVAGTCHADPGLPELCRQLGSTLEIDLRLGDKQLSDADFMEALAEADVVALPYADFYGSSGILGHALLLGRPVIASDIGLIPRRVRELGVGDWYPSGSAVEFVSRLRALSEAEAGRVMSLRAEHYLADARPEHFREVLANYEAEMG